MASPNVLKHVLLTGPPGVGKTTIIHKVCDTLQKRGIAVQGFYTEELRVNGRRTGFDVVTLDGHRSPLARISQESHGGGSREYRVGQYAVQLQSFEQTALPSIQNKGKKAVFVIDEIGKMELFSQSFVQSVRRLLTSGVTVVATIPIARGRPIPFVEEVRNRKDARLFVISRDNRDSILGNIVDSIVASPGQDTR